MRFKMYRSALYNIFVKPSYAEPYPKKCSSLKSSRISIKMKFMIIEDT